MTKKITPPADKSIVASKAQVTPQILPDMASQTRPAGKRADTSLDPKDAALQEDLAALLGDDIGTGQAERVLLAQAQPGVTSDAGAGAGSAGAGAGSEGAGAAAAGTGVGTTFPTSLLVLGAVGIAAAAGGGGGGDAAAVAATSATAITSNGGGATAAVNVAENATAVTTVVGTADAGETLTYSIVAGGDGAKFAINANTGALAFVAVPNFEVPTDTGANNVYDVTVQVSDGTNTDTQTIAVTVTAVNDNNPVFTSAATANVAENSTAVLTVAATDADLPAQTLTYSLSGGVDAAKFAINASTGALSFVAAPNFEAQLTAARTTSMTCR